MGGGENARAVRGERRRTQRPPAAHEQRLADTALERDTAGWVRCSRAAPAVTPCSSCTLETARAASRSECPGYPPDIIEGRANASAGNAISSAMRTTSITTNGTRPPNTVPMRSPGTTDFSTKAFMPTGGVM